MDKTFVDPGVKAGIIVLTFVAIGFVLYWFRDILAPFAMAIFIWLTIDAFARWLDKKLSFLPYLPCLIIALLIVGAGFIGVIMILIDTAYDVSAQAGDYAKRFNELSQPLFGLIKSVNPDFQFNWSDWLNEDNLSQIFSRVYSGASTLSGNFLFISLYVAFLFLAQRSFPAKMDAIFTESEARHVAGAIGERIRLSIESYVSVQTVISLMITAVSYIIMLALGLDNALFWALVIFILNYIPTVGSILAGLLPPLFAIVQYETLYPVIALAIGLNFAQSFFGNIIQPRMMSDSLNISTIVVILSLLIWGQLWGSIGMFLSAPLTVMLMIVLSQFKSTRWAAIMLSEDGNPEAKAKPAKPAL